MPTHSRALAPTPKKLFVTCSQTFDCLKLWVSPSVDRSVSWSVMPTLFKQSSICHIIFHTIGDYRNPVHWIHDTSHVTARQSISHASFLRTNLGHAMGPFSSSYRGLWGSTDGRSFCSISFHFIHLHRWKKIILDELISQMTLSINLWVRYTVSKRFISHLSK